MVVDGGVGNAILQNSIFSNIGLGIQLGSLTSPLPNDPGDTDSGPNDLQNYPVLTDALALKKNTSVTGTLNSAPNQAYRVELFANGACDPSGSGEGLVFLTAIPVATDGSGNGSFSAKLSLADAPPGTFITSTATGPSLESPLGETSEFSACVLVHPAPSPTKVRVLVEGPIRVAPGVPVEFPIQVEAKKVAGDLTGRSGRLGRRRRRLPDAGVRRRAMARARSRSEALESSRFTPSTWATASTREAPRPRST